MSSNIATVVTRIVALAGDISGVTTARDGWPNAAITSDLLPMIVVEVGDADWIVVRTAQQWTETREYALSLLLRAAITGRTDLDLTGRQALRAWLHTISNAFMKTPRLERSDSGLAGVINATIAADSRPGVVEHGTTAYWGALFTLNVSVMHNRSE